jgi:ketosteroid isomerase-like protein
MSQENVEVVRRLLDAVARRDAATVLALYDEDVEWDASQAPFARVSGVSVFRGHDGLRAAFREWYEAWDTVEDQVNELLDAGEHVVLVATVRGRGAASGAEVEWSSYASVWTIRDGKFVIARLRGADLPCVAEVLEYLAHRAEQGLDLVAALVGRVNSWAAEHDFLTEEGD